MEDDLSTFPRWTRILDANALERIQRSTREGRYNLSEFEKWWSDRYNFLESRGYRLRSRYRPGWKPQWIGTNVHPMYVKDSVDVPHIKVIDAIRVQDGCPVVIKRIPRNLAELSIARYLTSGDKKSEPWNRCIPLLDTLHDPHDDNLDLIVLPAMVNFREVNFDTANDVVDFVRQTLEALVFMHKHGVAHRDLSNNNIMMDGTPLYPNGFFTVNPTRDRTGIHKSEPLRRSEAQPVSYYIIDFGLSTLFDDPTVPRLVTGDYAQDHDVPELSDTVPYNPFLVDIFTLGNVFKKNFVERFSNLEYLSPLVDRMTRREPSTRPSAEEALQLFESIIARQSPMALKWRLRRPDETTRTAILRDTFFALRVCRQSVKRLLSRPYIYTTLIALAVGASISHVLGHETPIFRLFNVSRRLRPRN